MQAGREQQAEGSGDKSLAEVGGDLHNRALPGEASGTQDGLY